MQSATYMMRGLRSRRIWNLRQQTQSFQPFGSLPSTSDHHAKMESDWQFSRVPLVARFGSAEASLNPDGAISVARL